MTTTAGFQEALRELGVHDGLLSAAERLALDEDGFVLLHDIIDADQAERMRLAMEEVFVRDGVTPGCGRDSDFIENRSEVFDVCLTHPRFLAAIAHVLRNGFVSSGVHSRPNHPGFGHQHLHPDWNGDPLPPGQYGTCNSIWMLSEFTVENGATRVVPGSHREPLGQLADPKAPHPRQVHLCGPPGTVAVFNGHLWHSACLNRGRAPRANITSFWRTRGLVGGWISEELPEHVVARLQPAARFLQVGRSQP
jgi:ectoine hydroxylase-related dioxygenase (phytanoyl-CoA dioxygenase family)